MRSSRLAVLLLLLATAACASTSGDPGRVTARRDTRLLGGDHLATRESVAGVNAFDQPGVEESKEYARAMLGKEGRRYDTLRQRVAELSED